MEVTMSREETIRHMDQLVERGVLVRRADGKYDFSEAATTLVNALMPDPDADTDPDTDTEE